MAPVYTFDRVKAMTKAYYPKEAKTIASLRKALVAKKVPQAQADKLVAEIQSYRFSELTQDVSEYLDKNRKGTDLIAKDKMHPNAVERALQVAIGGPQGLFLTRTFDLSVHLKGTTLELWYTNCRGAKKTLASVTR